MPEPSRRGFLWGRYVLGPGGNSRDFWDLLAAMEAATERETRKALAIL